LRAYVIVTTAISAALLAAVIAFTGFADPYRMYRSPEQRERADNFDLFLHLRLHKPHAIAALQPENMIVGTSRFASLPPDILGSPAYNAALPGSGLHEMRRMVEHAQSIRPLHRLVVELGYEMFQPGHGAPAEVYREHRLGRIAPTLPERIAGWAQRGRDGWASLLSVDALLASFTLYDDRGGGNRRYLPDGTWYMYRDGGSSLIGYAYEVRFMRDTFSGSGATRDYQEFRRLLAFTRDHGIDTAVIIAPHHGSILDTIAATGQWDAYLAWQRETARLVASEFPEVALYGAESSATAVLEPIDTQAAHFSDGVHLSPAAGAMILQCIVAARCAPELAPVRLDNTTIEPYLAEVDRLRQRYPQANPQDYARVARWRQSPAGG